MKTLNKIIKFLVIFLLITGWLFSSWSAQAAVVEVRIESPNTEDCDIGNSVISPANPLCGFIPRTLTITAGDQIRWINNDPIRPHQPSSDPHPAHTIYPALNMAEILAGGQVTSGPLTEIGTWNYHDHLDISFIGIITVAAISSGAASSGGCNDCIPPLVLSFSVIDISTSTATLIWKTDEPSVTKVQIGTTTNFGLTVEMNGTLNSNHLVFFKNLLPDTFYYFQIYVEDKLGNKNNPKWPNQEFITLPLPIVAKIATATSTISSATTTAPQVIISKIEEKQNFKNRLEFSSKGDQVKLLQILLSSEPDVYPEKLVTGY
ncbi:MAG: hypothetical protein AAB789_00780, partial [Patescibacteria group bacterium]